MARVGLVFAVGLLAGLVIGLGLGYIALRTGYLVPQPSAPQSASPRIQVDPSSAQRGQIVTISASGFSNGGGYDVFITDSAQREFYLGSVAPATSTWSIQMQLPAELAEVFPCCPEVSSGPALISVCMAESARVYGRCHGTVATAIINIR